MLVRTVYKVRQAQAFTQKKLKTVIHAVSVTVASLLLDQQHNATTELPPFLSCRLSGQSEARSIHLEPWGRRFTNFHYSVQVNQKVCQSTGGNP